jgi:zinc transport system substrate-binding protein
MVAGEYRMAMHLRHERVLVVAVVIAAIVMAGAVYAMSQTPSAETGSIKVVAAFYPLAYFASEIGGEYASVTSLIPYNTEAHSWQPSTYNILAASDADILIYNGAGLDPWFEEDVLTALNVTGKIVVETTANLSLLPGSEGDHEHDSAEVQDAHDHGAYDPHTWISPPLAKQQAQKIYDAFVQADPSHSGYYAQRWASLSAKFDSMDQAYSLNLSSKTKSIIFVTHGAFGYLADRYGFEQVSVIGISADEQPSASALAGIVDMMIEHETYFVFLDPVYTDSYADTLKVELESRTNQTVTVSNLYLMLGPVDGMDYFDQMEANLLNLKLGLGVP